MTSQRMPQPSQPPRFSADRHQGFAPPDTSSSMRILSTVQPVITAAAHSFRPAMCNTPTLSSGAGRSATPQDRSRFRPSSYASLPVRPPTLQKQGRPTRLRQSSQDPFNIARHCKLSINFTAPLAEAITRWSSLSLTPSLTCVPLSVFHV